MKTKRLTDEQVESHVEYMKDIPISTLQTVIYVACGGGFIGRLHAEQPQSAYIDLRVGKLPYTSTEIGNMRRVLVALAKSRDLDPNDLPKMPNFSNLGVF
jgi:hypothetical protein